MGILKKDFLAEFKALWKQSWKENDRFRITKAELLRWIRRKKPLKK